jgi:Regulator of chromosome condensation (RCC1) repeat
VQSAAGVPITNVTAIASGAQQGYAVVDGGVLAWGHNAYSELGNGTTQRSPFAVPVLRSLGVPVRNLVTVWPAWGGMVATRADGFAMGWGDSHLSQLCTPTGTVLPYADWLVVP